MQNHSYALGTMQRYMLDGGMFDADLMAADAEYIKAKQQIAIDGERASASIERTRLKAELKIARERARVAEHKLKLIADKEKRYKETTSSSSADPTEEEM